jgi:hypothetical protein
MLKFNQIWGSVYGIHGKVSLNQTYYGRIKLEIRTAG